MGNPVTDVNLAIAMQLVDVTECRKNFLVGLEIATTVMEIDVPEELVENIKSDASMDMFLLKMAQGFASVYSSEEMEGLLEFYKTPIGVACIAKQATFAKVQAKIGQQHGIDIALNGAPKASLGDIN